MVKKTMFVALMLLVASVASNARGEELRAKIVCNDGVCVPVASGVSSADMKKLARLTARASRLRRAINEVEGRDRSRVDQFITDINRLKEQVADLQKSINPLSAKLTPTQYQAAQAEKLAKKALKDLNKLAQDVDMLQDKANATWRLAKYLLGRPTANLELSAYGHLTAIYGEGVGLMAALSIPLGARDLWTARLSGGMGLSPSVGLGWLAYASVTRRLTSVSNRMSVGPAVLVTGDQGDLLGSTQSWVLGGGLEWRYTYKRLTIGVTPFAGVAMVKDKLMRHVVLPNGGGYQTNPCYTLYDEHAQWDEYGSDKKIKFDGGVLLSVGAVLF